jgi:nicotinamide mononucleotide (NMN) deamidase PncC
MMERLSQLGGFAAERTLSRGNMSIFCHTPAWSFPLEKPTMSETVWTALISDLHASGYGLVAAVTGGGTKAISQLLEAPGGSRTLLEAVVPYSAAALDEWLGGPPDQYCSEATARAMAMAAWMRARHLAADREARQLVGLGVTASLASDRPKRGEHRIHVAVQTACSTVATSLTLGKDRRTRKKEEWLAAKLALAALGEGFQMDVAAAKAALAEQIESDEAPTRREQLAPAEWTELLLGTRDWIGLPEELVRGPRTIFPGAFNPPHVGHRRMAEIAARRTGRPVCCELSITNVDKPPLDFLEIRSRLDALADVGEAAEVLLTAAPTFVEKARLFPGCVFVAGADTIARIGQPRYYLSGESGRDAAITELATCGNRFLVFGRQVAGEFRTLGQLDIPTPLAQLCDEVPADEFQEDISSTELRGVE